MMKAIQKSSENTNTKTKTMTKTKTKTQKKCLKHPTYAIFLKSWWLTHSKYDDRYLTLVILFTPVTLVTLFSVPVIHSVLQGRVYHRFGIFFVKLKSAATSTRHWLLMMQFVEIWEDPRAVIGSNPSRQEIGAEKAVGRWYSFVELGSRVSIEYYDRSLKNISDFKKIF